MGPTKVMWNDTEEESCPRTWDKKRIFLSFAIRPTYSRRNCLNDNEVKSRKDADGGRLGATIHLAFEKIALISDDSLEEVE